MQVAESTRQQGQGQPSADLSAQPQLAVPGHAVSEDSPHHRQRCLLRDGVDVVEDACLAALVLVQGVQHMVQQHLVLRVGTRAATSSWYSRHKAAQRPAPAPAKASWQLGAIAAGLSSSRWTGTARNKRTAGGLAGQQVLAVGMEAKLFVNWLASSEGNT